MPSTRKAHCHLCGERDPGKFYRNNNGVYLSRCKECNKTYTRPFKRKKPSPDEIAIPTVNDKRYCGKCKSNKPASDFYPSMWRRNGVSAQCKNCLQEYYKTNGEKIYWQRLKAVFGLSREAYLKMLEEQNGVCGICKQPEGSKRFRYLAVDHDHTTGKIRGLLCHRCNKGLGVFKDEIGRLKQAIAYLESAEARPIERYGLISPELKGKGHRLITK